MEQKDPRWSGFDQANNANQSPEMEKMFASAKDKYTTTIDKAEVVVQGNETEIKIIQNTSMGYTDYKNIAQDAAQDIFRSNATNVARTVADIVKQELAEALRADRQEALFLNTSRDGALFSPADIPQDHKGISEWYYRLEEHKQYIVQAIALLHGAKTREIEHLREELYLPLEKDREQYQTSQQKDEDREGYHPLYPERLRASEQIYEHTYAEFRSVYGTERLFWQDTDERGMSIFSLRILFFLARESTRGGWGLSGKNFLDAVERWTAMPKGDCYWRAARALGIIWRCQDKERVQILANTWANTSTQRNWRKAASLLEGAYAVECEEESWKQDSLLAHSFVLAILSQWIERTHTATTNVSVYVGCAAAYTYGLLGKTFPQLALDGLDNLLSFPMNHKSQGIPARLFAAVVSNYIALTWAGHLKAVLARLATHARMFTHKRRFFSSGSAESVHYRLRRQATLEAVFYVFFMLTATSLPPDSADTHSAYSLTAPAEELLQADGLDILLAGTLTTHDSGWRKEVITLCCAALLDQQKTALVFEFLQQWVLLILQQLAEQKHELYHSLVMFFVELYITLKEWVQDLFRAGFRNQVALDAFKRHLMRWAQLHLPISDFAQEVLRSLER